MIYVHQILKQIRIDNQYNANAIAKILQVTIKQFSDYETSFRRIPKQLLTAWLLALDISDKDHAWYIQKHNREYILAELQKLSLTVPDQLLTKIADVLVFNKLIDISTLTAHLEKLTLPYVTYKPRSADIASDRIKDRDKQSD